VEKTDLAARARTCSGNPRGIVLPSNLLPLFSARIRPSIAIRSRLYEALPEILKPPLEIFSDPAPELEGQVKRNLIDLRVKLHASVCSFFLAQSWATSQLSVVSVVRASPRENTQRERERDRETRSKSSPRSISPILRPRDLSSRPTREREDGGVE